MKETIDYIQTLYYHDQANWNIAFVSVMFACLFFYAAYLGSREKTDKWAWLTFAPHRRGKMLRRARRNFVRQQHIDDMVNAIEERVYSGQYTRDEAKELYRDIKKVWPTVRDLFPKGELLKEAIKHRIAAGIHDPVVLPDSNKPKHAFEGKSAYQKVTKPATV